MSEHLVNALLDELADVLQTKRSLGVALANIVEAATHSVPGCDLGTIALSIGGRPATAAMTGTVALELDLAQYDSDDGPCLTSFRTASSLRLDIFEQGDVFPHVAVAAHRVAFAPCSWCRPSGAARPSGPSISTAEPVRSTRALGPSLPSSLRRWRSPSADHSSTRQPEPWSRKPNETPTTSHKSPLQPGC